MIHCGRRITARNALTSLVNPNGERTTWQYDALGRITTMTHGNGATIAHTYNAASWVTQIAHRKSDASVIDTFDYTDEE